VRSSFAVIEVAPNFLRELALGNLTAEKNENVGNFD
jgi:hypothetical protein